MSRDDLQSPALILASGSAARRKMLSDAGLRFEIIPSKIDEGAYSARNARDLALMLAQEKACDVSRRYPDALVIGSDQTLDFEGKVLSKAKTIEEAKARLEEMRGRTHHLYSAVSVARGGEEILWSCQDSAELTMHRFERSFFEAYVAQETDALLNCVGGYKIEGAGAWLFSSVKGDFFTVMGMPLLPLLGYLRKEHGLLP